MNEDWTGECLGPNFFSCRSYRKMDRQLLLLVRKRNWARLPWGQFLRRPTGRDSAPPDSQPFVLHGRRLTWFRICRVTVAEQANCVTFHMAWWLEECFLHSVIMAPEGNVDTEEHNGRSRNPSRWYSGLEVRRPVVAWKGASPGRLPTARKTRTLLHAAGKEGLWRHTAHCESDFKMWAWQRSPSKLYDF